MQNVPTEPVVTDDPVAWCVCLLYGCAVQKLLNSLMSYFGETTGGTRHVVEGSPDL